MRLLFVQPDGGNSIRVLIFNWRDTKNPAAGGAENFTYQVMRRFVQAGHEVDQVSAGFEGCEPRDDQAGIQVHRVGDKWSVYREAKRFYRRSSSKYDVVIDEINTRPFGTVKYVDKGERIFALVHQLAREFWYYEMPYPVAFVGNHFLEGHWLKPYHNVPTFAVSNSTLKDLDSLGFTKVRIALQGLNYPPSVAVPPKSEVPTLVFVGRFTKAKRPDHALEAFKIARKQIPNLQLKMIGRGYLRDQLIQDKSDGAEILGYLPLEEKSAIISRSHILLVPAVREGWSIVVTEANALGTPAIGYNVNGLVDSIKNGRTGLLCDPNPEDMASKIVELLSDQGRLKTMSSVALEDSRQYSWDSSARDMLLAIEDENEWTNKGANGRP
jgi:glycosyltransferase involved in cell wall biosynthesis